MTDDIVTRLRNGPHGTGWSCDFADEQDIINAAADEIERLRAEVRRVPLGHIATLCELEVASEEIERLRAAGDALHAAIRNHDLREEHIKAWEEARRD